MSAPLPPAAETKPSPPHFSPFDRTILAAAGVVAILIVLLIWRGDQTEGAAALQDAASPSSAAGSGLRAAVQTGGDSEAAAPQVLFTTVRDGAEQLFAVPWPPPAGASGAGASSAELAVPAALTSGSGSVWDYAPAPDGRRVAYSALTPEGGSDLWVVEIGDEGGAGDPTLLLACPQGFCANPAWSPDGLLLAYSLRNANEFAAAAVSPPRLFLLDVGSGETAPVFADSQKLGFDARWSADGQWLAYLSPDFYGVTAFNVETGDEQFYATQTGETGTWHPQRSVFLMSEQAKLGDTHVVHVYLVDPAANTRTNLSGAESLVEDGSPSWSPDGEWIAFRRSELSGERKSLSKQLWIMRADGSEARPLTGDMEVDYGAPSWSADGKTLLYHRFPLKGPNIVISTWTMDMTTGVQTEAARPGQRPQWSQ